MPSAKERMIAYHLARLKDKSPDVRVKSIEELALLQATQALSALEETFRTDPDEEVRKAAQKAGRELWLLKANRDKDDEDSQRG
jgi:HEAT repeat protein